MTRTVKDPETRRSELIDTAEELFLENGYEGTTVSEIVRNAGVAQGTFYHYFKSKDDVLSAITDRWIEEIRAGIEDIASGDDSDAIDKILGVFGFFSSLGRSRQRLVEYVHEERNAHLHIKFEKRVPQIIIPIFSRMIEEGVDEGFFDVRYPEMAALSIIETAGAISHIHETYRLEDKTEKMKEITDATFDFIERILGAEPGIFMEYVSKMEAFT
uniref:HTH-type transcriptional regulator BetI n=1 Tax=Candidatus Methanogaster sp. ANME-2c ERB4 TaxID=2759911 RepID=A0A7G9YAK6_9EURY|nr:HTH-type transcriptional regulator BetI [Methanosarcinales archaeon ANME-2c ERB4]QNO44984.1 HTH-type transcriptional regulator BetI [Methanosarcinales archaeon ANME-2c ERB4]QNO45040.1 HTH-type transcriptional regulator BetI [Methanosarcinales archaeon ANME-2c ERB4]